MPFTTQKKVESREKRKRSHERKRSQQRALAEHTRERKAYTNRLMFDSDLQMKQATMRRNTNEFHQAIVGVIRFSYVVSVSYDTYV